MSRFVRSLIERARGEGAMLQPRPRSRFEPSGFAEVELESPGASRASSPPLVSPSLSNTTNIDNNRLTNVTNVSSSVVMENRGGPEARDARRDTDHSNTVVRAETVHSTERTEHTERVEREQTHDHSHETLTREREQLTHREQRTIEKRERQERSERTRHTTHRDRIVERDDARPIQITIGRVDVRAVAPQTQTPQRPPQKPKPAPLTLDDYLRGKR